MPFAEALYRKELLGKADVDGWNVLIDLLYDNTEYLIRIASQVEWWNKIWYGFWIKIMPRERMVYVYFLPEQKISKKSVEWYKNIFARILSNEIISELRTAITKFATGNKVNLFFPTIPVSEARRIAHLVIDDYLLDKNLLKLSTDYKPDYILNILRVAIKEKYQTEDVIDLCLSALLSNKFSVLYREIYKFNTPDRAGRNNSQNSQLLSIFFDLNKVDNDFINNTHIYGAVINFMYNHLKSFRDKDTDPYNDAYIDVYPPSSNENPILVSLQLYDWIVRTALELNVEWHMWLMRLSDWTKNIVTNMTVKGQNWNDMREFPTIYFFALYEIIDKLTGWIDFIEESSSIVVKPIQGDVEKNGNILQNIIETIAFYLKYVANSEMNEHYKEYLGDIIWRRYFELLNSKRTELKPYGDLLLKQMIEKLTLYGSEFDKNQFKMMFISLYRFDVIGLHSSNDFKLAGFVKEKMMEIARSNILPFMRYNNQYKSIVELAREYLNDSATVRSDGVYIRGHYQEERIFSVEDLNIG